MQNLGGISMLSWLNLFKLLSAYVSLPSLFLLDTLFFITLYPKHSGSIALPVTISHSLLIRPLHSAKCFWCHLGCAPDLYIHILPTNKHNPTYPQT